MKMRVVACDDDKLQLAELGRQLQRVCVAKNVQLELATFTEGEDCYEYLLQYPADVVFMDIYLEHGTGVELVRRLQQKERKFKLVFLTTSNEFANESYELDASYYLLKPLQEGYLEIALGRAGVFDKEQFVVFDTGTELVKINPRDVIVVEVQDKYCYIHTVHKTYKVYSSINKVREKLPQDYFLFTYRSVLINMHYVENCTSKYFLMSDGFQAPIRVRDGAAVRNAYMQWALAQD